MAYNNSNSNKKDAGGFMNVWFQLPNKEYRKIGKAGVALYASSGVSNALLKHALTNPDFEYNLMGKIKLWNPDQEVEVVDLFGNPSSGSTGTDDEIPF